MNRMVREGQKFLGYTVKSIDVKTEMVVLEQGTITLRLKLGEGAPSFPLKKQEASAIAVEKTATLQGPIPTEYEPTPSEKAQSIDPNDPATWPASYRGPGIERSQSAK
jgi:hypothetical protein